MDFKYKGKISNRSMAVEWSGIRTISTMLRNSQNNPISLSIGQPDFDTPKHIREAAKDAIDQGYTRYPPAKGFDDLRQAVSNKLKLKNNIIADPHTEIYISIGAMQGIFNTILHVVEPGDKVIVIDPGYDYYSQIRLFGGVPTPVVAHEHNDFKVDPADIRKAVTNKTKLIILNTPSNPTGAVLDKEILYEISKIAQHNGIFVLSDEPYEDIVFNGKHISIGSFDGMQELCITVFTFSKSYAMTGWRVGYVVANKAIINEMEKLMEHMASGVTAVSQRAAMAALHGSDDIIAEMANKYKKRRDIVYEALCGIDCISCKLPEATFYAFPNIKGTGMKSWDLSKYLIESQGVGTVPGSVFGNRGEGFLRISFAAKEENIREGISRFRKGIQAL